MRQQFLCLLPDRLGDRGGSAEQSALKGYYAVLEDAPKIKGSSLWSPKPGFLSLSGPSIQGVISGTTGQVGGSGIGSQDYPSLLFGGQRALPFFFLFNGRSKRQPRAEVANDG